MSTLSQLSNASVTALGLAMDCTAVAASYGLVVTERRTATIVKLATAFGVFQAGFYVAGALAGAAVSHYIARWGGWIAFAILVALGAKMLRESAGGAESSSVRELTWSRLIVLAVATSIDAMAAGLAFSAVGGPITASALLVGGFSFACPFLGFYAAARMAGRLGPWAERAGGIALIGIGTKILISSLVS